MRRDPQAPLCGISPLLGIPLSAACVGESFHGDAVGDGGAACEGCRVDFIAAHWYACDRPALERNLGELERYRRPISLTEFSRGDGADRSPEAQAATMREAVPLLESDPDVFRYAWFSGRTEAIPNVDLLGASGELTALGALHVSLPHPERCGP
ncbi:glycosyl hydrolase (plasmid) [Sorangium sp. So ce119]|uniref:glycosyl hydrolase n=1 Tax=Sorangium sp. So ce119 TaxID=3133279 RepID=UPI003F6351DB